ncbi:hypothetical protein GCM10025867_04040 [Frondihabitans sucicola]|uniref:Glycosyl hydrolase family 13 catalytic domain-containing protein n=1 Tax=Frondihabitans sucicola TaxID=1268041 RepID=A0ABM8GIG7_9MICO|nr:hypothetical protein GCM10025867_04040 [Frondihabitans sucicola]
MRPEFHRPYAISMWDFSWLERRWPGAGYENWDTALSELVERGYDAVRIDAYPHLLSADPTKAWELLPAWNQTSWGLSRPSRFTSCRLSSNSSRPLAATVSESLFPPGTGRTAMTCE